MNYTELVKAIGNVDIYIIDQILKGRYQSGQSILDAGCGSGRNLKWFYQNHFHISGIDSDVNRINKAKELYPNNIENFTIGNLDALPFNNSSFDHVVCCAVLHFATNELLFKKMFSQMVRVLKSDGTLLIRSASNIGLDGNTPFVQDGLSNSVGSFYLTRRLISEMVTLHNLELLEPIKTTNVQDIRAMTTLVFQKKK